MTTEREKHEAFEREAREALESIDTPPNRRAILVWIDLDDKLATMVSRSTDRQAALEIVRKLLSSVTQ